MPSAWRQRQSECVVLSVEGSWQLRVLRIASPGAVAFAVEDEVLRSLGESLGNDLCVERVGKDLGPVLERPVGGDTRGAPIVLALRDYLEGELCLRRIHAQDGEVVDDDEVART